MRGALHPVQVGAGAEALAAARRRTTMRTSASSSSASAGGGQFGNQCFVEGVVQVAGGSSRWWRPGRSVRISRVVNMLASLHPENAELGVFRRRIHRARQAQGQHAAGVGRVDDAVVPQPCRRHSRGAPASRTARASGALKAASSSAAQEPPLASMPSRLTVASTPAACSPPITEMRRVGPHPQEARRIGAAAHAVVAGTEAAADDDGEFGHLAEATAVTILAPSRAMPPFSYLRPTMKPVMFCRKTSGMPRWAHSSMKWAPFRADSREQDAVVGDDAHRVAPDAGEAAHQASCRSGP